MWSLLWWMFVLGLERGWATNLTAASVMPTASPTNTVPVIHDDDILDVDEPSPYRKLRFMWEDDPHGGLALRCQFTCGYWLRISSLRILRTRNYSSSTSISRLYVSPTLLRIGSGQYRIKTRKTSYSYAVTQDPFVLLPGRLAYRTDAVLDWWLGESVTNTMAGPYLCEMDMRLQNGSTWTVRTALEIPLKISRMTQACMNGLYILTVRLLMPGWRSAQVDWYMTVFGIGDSVLAGRQIFNESTWTSVKDPYGSLRPIRRIRKSVRLMFVALPVGARYRVEIRSETLDGIRQTGDVEITVSDRTVRDCVSRTWDNDSLRRRFANLIEQTPDEMDVGGFRGTKLLSLYACAGVILFAVMWSVLLSRPKSF
ncbi:t22.8 [Tupaiid betaherpesvirus 1]|uniref:T22.8 n=1 Tax=Tupaiid herpesvirus 1 (strain 1) TaxID=10397 RepID=Q91TT1_TUHV1|nr:t22.8 [Tupaiid betaherpesvirus 1]AAK57056.1 t22.8 [Tupaiid betaherpesvirus 1]